MGVEEAGSTGEGGAGTVGWDCPPLEQPSHAAAIQTCRMTIIVAWRALHDRTERTPGQKSYTARTSGCPGVGSTIVSVTLPAASIAYALPPPARVMFAVWLPSPFAAFK